MKYEELHQRAREAATKYFRAEAGLLDILQKIDAVKAYREFEYTNLFSYAVQELKLSESTAFNFINVARKATQVPALKQEIEVGALSVAKARKIVPVLTVQNQNEWIEKAKHLSSRRLEQEVARVAPREANPTRIYYVTGSRMRMTLDIEAKVMDTIRRVQDIESQRQQKAVTLEETLDAMSTFYVEKNDPMEKAKRATAKDRPKALAVLGQASPQGRKPLRAHLNHAVTLRDGGQCTEMDRDGKRCSQRRWLQTHHLVPVAQGGSNTLENLVTLCAAHHRMRHPQLRL